MLLAISLSLSLVTHILISVVFTLASRKSINPELAKATILCLDVMAFAVGETVRPWFVLCNIRAGKDDFWHFLLEELGYTLVTVPIYIFIMRAFLMQLSLPGPYYHKNLRRLSIWTGSLTLTVYTMVYLNSWKRIKASKGADAQVLIGRIGKVHFMPVWYALAVTILISTITILRTPFVEQWLLYGYYSYRAFLHSGLVWIPFVGTRYCEAVRIERGWVSQYFASLQHTEEDYRLAL